MAMKEAERSRTPPHARKNMLRRPKGITKRIFPCAIQSHGNWGKNMHGFAHDSLKTLELADLILCVSLVAFVKEARKGI